MSQRPCVKCAAALAALLLLPALLLAHDPEFSSQLDRDRCTFSPFGSNPFLPLWPGYSSLLAGEEEDDGETVEIEARITILEDTQLVDGVLTRVLEERESEDGELVEVSRNFVAHCRETGDVWYFGEDVDDYEDGEIVGHSGAWRAGRDGAEAGILMPGSPLVGARFFQERAPGIALDRGEIIALDQTLTVPFGTFLDVLEVEDSDALDPGSADAKFYAPGVGLIKDEELELVAVTPPSCQPDATTLCLNDGRFHVRAEWRTEAGDDGQAMALQSSDDTGELWFFNAENTELLVKVLDACSAFDRYWVFAAGLTNVEVTLTVTDTRDDTIKTYENPLGQPFQPILDTAAFATCP